ncbi:MAG: hypothetical protein ACI85O_002663 [Saprospiraceae bacterium]|jgi:hypothetical protein
MNSLTKSNWFTFFRITLPLLLLSKTLSFFRDIPILWFENGIVKNDILSASYKSTVMLTFSDITNLAQSVIYPSITFNQVVMFAVIMFMVSLACLSIGIFTKISNVLALFLHLTIQASFYNYTYGLGQFITILLFYLLICKIPREVKSLDNYFFKKDFLNFGFNCDTILLTMKIHICIVYFIGGFEKAIGINWWNGEALWRAIHSPYGLISHKVINNIPYKFIFVLGGWLTLLIECGYPVFVNIKKTRNIWIFLILGMHTSIIAFLGLFHFGIMMIFFNIITYVIPNLNFENSGNKEYSPVHSIA